MIDIGRTAIGDRTSAKRASEVNAIGTVKGFPRMRVKQANEMSMTCNIARKSVSVLGGLRVRRDIGFTRS